MSSFLEGVVCAQPISVVSPCVAAEHRGAHLLARQLQPGTSIVIATNPRFEGSYAEQVRDVARLLSRECGRALFVSYDTRVAGRHAELYESGSLARAFDENDELYVPLRQDGDPDLEHAPLAVTDLSPDCEYETVKNAIQLGLEQLGVLAAWDEVKRLAAST